MTWLRRPRRLSLVDRINEYVPPRIVPIYSSSTGEIIGWMKAS